MSGRAGFRESSSARVTISQTLAEVEWSGGGGQVGPSGRELSAEHGARTCRVDVEAPEGGARLPRLGQARITDGLCLFRVSSGPASSLGHAQTLR